MARVCDDCKYFGGISLKKRKKECGVPKIVICKYPKTKRVPDNMYSCEFFKKADAQVQDEKKIFQVLKRLFLRLF